MSSELRPGGPLPSTPAAPVFVMRGAIHCDDLVARSGEANADIGRTQRAAIEQMKQWVGEFYSRGGGGGGTVRRRARTF